MRVLAQSILVTWIITVASCHLDNLEKRQGCSKDYKLCNPDGAKELGVKTMPKDLEGLYISLLGAVKDIPSAANGKRNAPQNVRRDGSASDFCCRENLSCLLLTDASAPFCYDRFTTNYLFPDGSSGSLVTGDFSSRNGIKANLVSGNYQSPDGKQENIYSTATPPNTATLAIPSPFTAAGVGSAIPITALGGVATYVTTLPATTIPPSVGPSTTVPGTTILERVTTVTTTISGSVAAAAAPTSSSTAGGAVPTNVAGVGAAGIVMAAILAVL